MEFASAAAAAASKNERGGEGRRGEGETFSPANDPTADGDGGGHGSLKAKTGSLASSLCRSVGSPPQVEESSD